MSRSQRADHPTPRRAKIRLGFAVKALGAAEGPLPSSDARRARNIPSLGVSIQHLHRVFDYLDEVGVKMYRMSSEIAPYATHPGYPDFHDAPKKFERELRALGERAEGSGVRLSFHPGQYTVLNSTRPEVVSAA